MAIRSRKRLLLAFIYLGVLFTGIGGIYLQLRQFEGVMVIPPQRSEKLVVAAADEHHGFMGLQRNMPIDLLPLNNKREAARFLDSSAMYHAADLPFQVRVDGIEVIEEFPPREFLEIAYAGRTYEVDWSEGNSFEYAGQSYRMMSILPWTGLVRHPSGAPTAVVSLEEGGTWHEDILVFHDKWVFPSPSTGIRLQLAANEDAAQDSAEDALNRMPQGRWGVRESGRIQWISSVLPGAGLTLNDGTEVSLISLEKEHAWGEGDITPAILLEEVRNDQTKRVWVRANVLEDQDRFAFEYIPALDRVVILFAWRDGKALATLYQKEKPVLSQVLEETEAWQPPGMSWRLRLDQFVAEALVVQSELEVVQQAVLKSDSNLLRLREGSMERLGEGTMRYRRAPLPPAVRYTLSFVSPGEAPPTEASIATGETARFGDWRFTPEPHVGGGKAAVLHARRTVGGPATLLGIAMVVGGSFGLVFVRFRPVH